MSKPKRVPLAGPKRRRRRVSPIITRIAFCPGCGNRGCVDLHRDDLGKPLICKRCRAVAR